MKFSLFIFLFLNTVFCFSQEAVFSIKEPLKKFPTTQEGSIIEHTFEYENKGKSPLLITDYSVGCKCTQVIYSKDPILPGQKGTVKIIFDTKGKYLQQDRTVYLMVNTKKKIAKLRFKVFVEPKK